MRTSANDTALRHAIDGSSGFAMSLRLSTDELRRVRELIEAHWLGVIRQHAPQHAAKFEAHGLARYHELAHLLDHAALWPKRARILSAEAVAEIRRMPFMQKLAAELGPFEISDEDEVGWEEIYFRIVRPAEPGDVGPLHADRWFWDLGHGVTPPDRERVKVWVAVFCEPGRNGLRVVPGSHRRHWRHHGELRHGMMKPVFDEDEEQIGAQLLATEPGDAVVFNDALLHGGAPNCGTTTRISFELTLFVRPRAPIVSPTESASPDALRRAQHERNFAPDGGKSVRAEPVEACPERRRRARRDSHSEIGAQSPCKQTEEADLVALAKRIRSRVLRMSHHGRSPHLGSCLSCIDILVAAYFGVLRLDPLRADDPNRDRFILSKGHAAPALYATLAERGFFPSSLIDQYNRDGAVLAEQPAPFCVPGLEAATGSLGHGLSLGAGMALAGRMQNRDFRVFAVLSDGECNEGSVWEAAMFAAAQKLDRLCVVVDYNRWQATGRSNEIMALDPLAEKWRAFGWTAHEVDGHDIESVRALLTRVPDGSGKPVAIVANTIKGKGVSFMEDDNNWHYRVPNEDELAAALRELE